MLNDVTKILVTGAGGYIGSHITKRLLREGCAVIAFDNFSRGYREPLEVLKKYGDLEVIEGDLTRKEDIARIFNRRQIDAVMHLAALCLVDESVKNPEIYFKNNVIGTANLLEAMSFAGVHKLIFSSTCAVYGNAKHLPIDEEHPTNPVNPYGESKLQAEREIEKFGRERGLNYVILRYFNVCGADEAGEIGDSKKPSELLVQNAVRGALGIAPFKLTCPKVNTPDGTPIRDYVDVEDIATAHIKAYKYLKKGALSGIFNLGNGRGWSVKEILGEIKKELEREFVVTEGILRRGEYGAVYADISKAGGLLGWKPQKTLRDSILGLQKWYEKKPEGYKS